MLIYLSGINFMRGEGEEEGEERMRRRRKGKSERAEFQLLIFGF